MSTFKHNKNIKNVVLSLSKYSVHGFYGQIHRQAPGDKVILCMLTVLFFLFLSENTLAQTKNDTLNDKVVYIVNGIPVSKDKINNEDILTKDVIKGPSIAALHSEKEIDSVILIITKSSAITQYQKKFGTFSKKYKSYLDTHQNNDEDFIYVLDGVQLKGKRNDIIKTLYEIPSKKIKEVGFNKKQSTDGSATLVIINTKQ
ncbi:hypothetical protein ACPPVU_19775 [Mucilaginibacter sp. McL0603]|uniref:hypothetical protein n=1 Tax=Mucilaginibacter sp. McL0603 TaxID=3415670 RepID=UPI003CF0171D